MPYMLTQLALKRLLQVMIYGSVFIIGTNFVSKYLDSREEE